MNFTLKVIKNGEVVQRLQTHSIRRFLNHLRTINWKDGVEKVYLRVSYGKGFWNDGWYENKKALWSAFDAFREEEVKKNDS